MSRLLTTVCALCVAIMAAAQEDLPESLQVLGDAAEAVDESVPHILNPALRATVCHSCLKHCILCCAP